MSGFNLADLFERVADAVPDREVIVSPARRLTFAQLDERANRLANVLLDLGIERDEHIGLQLLNGSEYIEGMLAAFKIGAVPVNVNFRYVEGELRHLYDDADLVAVIHHQQFSPRVAAVMPKAVTVRNLIVVTETSGA
ncbi:MAG TPA: AMP-binding protein, partial [Mycobacteriales bacterium]|nr:AMP-binding protein [Mycobacteriales bacterium]